jgi:hypothetical protein
MIRSATLPIKKIIRVERPRVPAAGASNVALRCAQAGQRPQTVAAAFRFARLLGGKSQTVAAPAAGAALQPAAETGGLTARTAEAADLPWLQAWAAQLGLPAPRSRRVRSFMLLKDSQRVGYIAARHDMLEAARGREPILWIVSAFLIPSHRGRGLILRFCEILSRQYYRKGKVGCRVAAGNAAMLKLMARGGWKQLHATRRFVDFMLELDAPFEASRRI